ncbi:gamma-glutamyltransferase [Thermaerobacter marianensis DSM 12885]|uniref:Gamma-glutamyltransferase n=1 Tax=Thermaerobacter marianensis (strain ATCC 700841 / DSM 12885 / JCM 10246 / 7p75a) TaxID=644966 RepID=E6SGC8_THEM7|nr:gamma-glutamyltransferase family protein [Thermaerobacter marianensis]ADU51580.1 gamma-glutamyltransferase [Thermaerobacter marianensis DSM 12885]
MIDPALTSDPGRPVWARNGMVASGQPLATAAGLEVLARGGNAVDAALAMAAVTSVTMPEMCGLGGDAFALVYDARTRTVTAFNGSGPAPMAATVERYRAAGHTEMPFEGWWSVAVPGAVGVYLEMHARFGSKPLEELWAPAIRYAREGFPIDARLAANIAAGAAKLAQDPAAAAVFLAAGPQPKPGTVLKNPDLARSFERVLADGAEGFYKGELARAIGDASRAAGGLLTAEDMAAFEVEVYRPLVTTYRGYRVFETAPPSQGLILLEMLNLLEGFDLAGQSPTDPDVVHLLVEIKKLAFADRNAYLGDPRFVQAPVERLLSKEYAARRRRDIDPERANNAPAGGELDGDTTSFVAVDAEGNAVSFIHSISALWGAGVMVPGTGFLMNNRAGRGFVLSEEHPNGLAPGKRTMHTLNTYLVTRIPAGDGEPGTAGGPGSGETDGGGTGDAANPARDDGELVLVGNTPGGDGQPQWNLQVLVNVLDFGMNAYRAVAAPRWTSFPGTDPINLKAPLELRLESRFPAETAAELLRRGHVLRGVGPWAAGGSAMLIRVLEDGVYEGAADPRDGGVALGL